MNNSDYDSDFSDAGEEESSPIVDRTARRINKKGIKVRGADCSWVEIARFVNASEFNSSEIATELKKNFSCRKNR